MLEGRNVKRGHRVVSGGKDGLLHGCKGMQASAVSMHSAHVARSRPPGLMIHELMNEIMSSSLHAPFPPPPMQIMEINEAPVYLRLDPLVSPAAKDLPVCLYESGE